jgi:DNA-binding CsgD family transcriptional regulator
LDNIVADFTAHVVASNGLDEICELLLSTFQKFNYRGCAYSLRLPTIDPPNNNTIIFHSLGDDWLNNPSSKQQEFNKLLADHIVGHVEPLVWSDLFELPDDPAEERKLAGSIENFQQLGWRHGVTLPLGKLRNYHAGLSLFADPKLNANEHKQLFLEKAETLQQLAQSFHDHVDRPRLLIEHLGITNREIDVMQWMSQGLSAKAISEKLGNSPHTVNKQITSAKEKLSSQTGAQAVSKAIMLQII